MKNLLTTYLKSLATQTAVGDSREESYYDILKSLFSDFPLGKDRQTQVTVLPKKTEAGNPDFRIWDGDHFIVGYIEAKLPGTNLDQIESTGQLQRYLSTFPNLILTDFYEFRLYRDGREILRTQIARPFIAHKLKTIPPLEKAEKFQQLAETFFAFKLPVHYTAEGLAIDLAKRASFLRDQVISEELRQVEAQRGELYGFYQAFQRYLLPDLTPNQFADLYAQTITYSLFAARTRVEGDFHRKIAVDYIPHTSGILRDVFRYLSLSSMSLEMEVIVDDIASVLNAADIKSILDEYYRNGKGEDPIIHFYETFLNQYDPQTRERRGVYYTPEPVVKYIVRSVHEILKHDFNLPDGFADERVTVLDPAAGTLTFPVEAIKLAVEEHVGKYGAGGKESFIHRHILQNFYAFELMMAPYAIGHMKIGYLLETLGYKMRDQDAFKLYLTNTLEMEDIAKSELPGVRSLSEESRLAGKVKRDPILVILGNPPYSGNSANKNDWTEKLLKEDLDGTQSFYKIDGEPLGERNPKMLQDDYVKFLRFAQWKINKAGKGILAMITNHAWLENPTFRGMRQSMLETFDTIYILDLHGNSLRRETTPVGGKDENVFDIRVGTAISIFIKIGSSKTKIGIEHSDLFGERAIKYRYLSNENIMTTLWSQIDISHNFYIFKPRILINEKNYYKYPSIIEIFPLNSTGIKTHRDSLVIDINRETLGFRIQQLSSSNLPDELIRRLYSLTDTPNWSLEKTRRKLFALENQDDYINTILYRPFDKRFIFYHEWLVDRPRKEVMRHMLKNNLGLVTVRQVAEGIFNHAMVVDSMIDNRFTSSNKGIAFVFPLYLYPELETNTLFPVLDNEKTVNIKACILDEVQLALNMSVTPEDFLYYVYSVLCSPSYRQKYADFLKVDYPRIPFTSDPKTFMQMAALGKCLVNLHLLKSDELNNPIVKYQGSGSDRMICKPVYTENEKRLYINDNYYFENLEPEVWSSQIGGYQVLDKFLKDRKGQPLDDPRHLLRVATALSKTIEIQKEIDLLYPKVEENLVAF